MSDHIDHLEDVFRKISNAGLKIKESKCKFGVDELNYLGFLVSGQGIKPDPKKLDPILNWKKPTDLKGLQRFLGSCCFYQRFIKNFSNLAMPLYRLTSKAVTWFWDNSCENAFTSLKNKLCEIPSLNYPVWGKEFNLHCDASDHAIGAVLSQNADNIDKPIAFFSRILTSAERNYSTSDRECLAIVSAIKKFRYYLYGNKFSVFTDHNPLTYLKSLKIISGRRARWILDLEEYDFDIRHVSGQQNIVADGLSRSLAALELKSSINLEEEQINDLKLSKVMDHINLKLDDQTYQDEEINSLLQNTRKLKIVQNVLFHTSRRGLRQ
ncbi:Retrovirus-related Pol polyprotein [Thelohanellus kitauei]|uniref:Retrovirus-related Pol polyprotein n=1 Tax=Thelohanellus kitauei TaxID=669202 RepID=A0A0C2MZ54_THEKT|nr:Retrovirus-related Pol polyprotein [Thelohanellus kitauei]